MSTGPDWGHGAYEVFAPSLEPSARHLVDLAAPQPGERAIDLGAGHGNATLPLAERGAQVTAVDPSLRLLGVAAQRAVEAGLAIKTVVARAESLPLPDGDADLIVSNFGMIFSPDPPGAIGEAMRVLAPGGRLLYSAWLPRGAIADLGVLIREAITSAHPAGELGAGVHDPGAARAPAWHEPATLAAHVPGGEAAITIRAEEAIFAAESGEAWMLEQEAHHPMWLAAREALDDEDRWRDLMTRSIAMLDAAATPGEPFQVASPYVIVEIHPQR